MTILARTATIAGLALLLGLPQGAVAQQAPARAPDAGPGMLTAQVFSKPPEMPGGGVSPYDDSGLNLRVKADFEAQLAAQQRGRVESEARADYLLLFESGIIPAEDVPQGPSLGSAEVTESGVDVSVNVWSLEEDSVLGGRQEQPDVDSSVFHINAVLRERSSGKVAWQGDAYYRLSGPETERVARAMVAPLVEKIGQSVAREPFEID
ncbi:hypothetical protein [Pelagibius marinus]|uniref:hypothetical protein n=1 Tax=Pelagibius marinus TaxID=2762760 RepID=UPI00187258D4|nr:hypothetical protein [Pelagibius marinus]